MPRSQILNDIAEAFALLTRFPVRATSFRGAGSAWAWPLTGLATGTLAALAAAAALWLGLPTALAACIALALLIVPTGALHEDGLADSADGLWGGHTRARRLEIMKDSRIGSYGVIALILSLLARFAALFALIDAGQLAALPAAALLSRAPMAALMAALPNARQSGLAHDTGRPSAKTATTGLVLAAAIALPLTGTALIAALFWGSLAALATAAIAKRKIGGQTGDILGACQQVTEITVLFALTAAL
ncbi:MAG: adenosylcobinamide-GDP ribazoletransferase [Rhodobacterales bacterium]|nr:MAG: adenosylcobinamide-GDP ribazoletransferase [Rhodobacterales bacterium]